MKPFAHIRRMLPLVALTTAAVTATITTSAQTASGLAPAVEQRIRMNTSSAVNANWTFRFGGSLLQPPVHRQDLRQERSDHPLPVGLRRADRRAPGLQVHRSQRPRHGDTRQIHRHARRQRMSGRQVTDLDGNSAADVVIRQTPFDTLMSKYRYRSAPTPNTARTSPRWRSSCWNAAATTSHR